jgi:hypothetical protein
MTENVKYMNQQKKAEAIYCFHGKENWNGQEQ